MTAKNAPEPLRRAPRPRQSTVEVEGGADESQVSECLREVAEVLAALAELLAVEPEVVGIAEHLLEVEPGPLEIAEAREAFHVPEGTHAERSLVAGQAIGERVAEPIAVDERIADEVLFDRA